MRHLAMLLLAMAVVPAAASTDVTDYFPTCNSPQPTAPLQVFSGHKVARRTGLAWNGRDYGMAFIDTLESRLYFTRIYADGSPASPAVLLTGRYTESAYPPSLVWNGSGYGVAWVEQSATTAFFQVYFARLTADGAMIGSEQKVSFAGSPETARSDSPALAWSGVGYGVVWADSRNYAATGVDLFITLLDGTGAVANGGAAHDLALSNAPDLQSSPVIAWSRGAASYVLAWQDHRSGNRNEIYGGRVTPDGVWWGSWPLASNVGDSRDPALAETGNGLGLVWRDTLNGYWDIYFARLSSWGGKVGNSEIQITDARSFTWQPRITWTGAEFGVAWEDDRTTGGEIWFQRISAAGALAGANTQVSYSFDTVYPELAFGRYGYLITGMGYEGPLILQAWGCGNDATPPSCPQNFVAYGITGTTATVAWIPSVEDATDIAYYEIYRNSNFLGRTSANVYNDSGLGLSSTYNYYVRPVNAAQLVNGSCTNSIYVNTNASLTLSLGKSTADAALSWTDAGFNHYNIFRGTDPRVMQEIGNTPSLAAQDANVLNDSLNYFYTVDNPGPAFEDPP